MTTERPFLGALFDMDGLLLDSERLLLACSREVGIEMQLGDLEDALLAVIGIREEEAKALLAPHIGNSKTMQAFEIAVHERYRDALKTRLKVKQNVRILLNALRDQGTPCAVATSSTRAHARELLARTQLLDFFKVIIGGDQVSKAKPDPEIYNLAAKGLGIAADRAAAFEDSEPGTRAAIASGASVVQVPDLVQPSSELVRLGHVITPDILSGARTIGLIQ